jgi:hypothetical protein
VSQADSPNGDAALAAQIAKVDDQIGRLDDKFLDGELSEEHHAKMLARLEGKLADLTGRSSG